MKVNQVSSINQKSYVFTALNSSKSECTVPEKTFDLQILNKNYNQVSVSFCGTRNASELVKQIPLEDRLASLFQNFRSGDLILTGEDIAKAKKAMYESAGLVKNVIKRAFFVEDDKLEGYLGFVKSATGDTEVINLNQYNINLISGGKNYVLNANDNFYIVPGDVLALQGNMLKIKEEPKTDLSGFRKYFTKAFDFEANVSPEIERLNKKSISLISPDVKKIPSKVTFADVGGQDKLINEMKKSIIYPIRYPQGYENIEVNHGFILYGPPGTGKTHIARALANEADANFISLNGLDLESKWVGESEANWRNLFAEAKANQPSIIFIDEFDAVARSRASHDEYGNKVVNQILTLMTDIDNEADNVFVIGATNNFKALDSAITRSGRFGKHLEVSLPDLAGTKKILEIHAKNKPLDDSVSIDELSKKLYEMKASGADIKYIVNEAHSIGYERAGIFEKMENKALKNKDIENFRITNEDINTALKTFALSRNANGRRPIGFTN